MGEALALILPTLYEVWQDRHGESKKDKVKDAIITVALWLSFALMFRWLFETPVVGSLALLLGWRILVFDYLVQCVLIRNGVIIGHWFYYQGKTAKWDRVLSHLNPWIVLVLRVLFFAGTVFVYLKINAWTYFLS